MSRTTPGIETSTDEDGLAATSSRPATRTSSNTGSIHSSDGEEYHRESLQQNTSPRVLHFPPRGNTTSTSHSNSDSDSESGSSSDRRRTPHLRMVGFLEVLLTKTTKSSARSCSCSPAAGSPVYPLGGGSGALVLQAVNSRSTGSQGSSPSHQQQPRSASSPGSGNRQRKALARFLHRDFSRQHPNDTIPSSAAAAAATVVPTSGSATADFDDFLSALQEVLPVVKVPELTNEEWDDFLVYRMSLHWGFAAVGLFVVLYKGFTAVQHRNNGYVISVIFDVIILILGGIVVVLDTLRHLLYRAGKLTEYNARLWGNTLAVLCLWTFSGILLRYEHVECWAIGEGRYGSATERKNECLCYHRLFLLSFALTPLYLRVGFGHVLALFSVSAAAEVLFTFWLNPVEVPKMESGSRLMLVILFSIAQGSILYHREREEILRFVVSRTLQRIKRENAERADHLVHLLQSIAPPRHLLHVLRHGNRTDESSRCSVLVIQIADFNVWLSARQPPKRTILVVDGLISCIEEQLIRFGVEKLFFRADTYVASWELRTSNPHGVAGEGSTHDPRRLVEFALAVCNLLRSWVTAPPCQLGIGTGPCKGAVIGHPKLSYVLLGEAYDLACQAARFSPTDGVVASKATVECCGHDVVAAELLRVPVGHFLEVVRLCPPGTLRSGSDSSSTGSSASRSNVRAGITHQSGSGFAQSLRGPRIQMDVPSASVDRNLSASDDREGKELLPLALKHYRKPTDTAVYDRLAGVMQQREQVLGGAAACCGKPDATAGPVNKTALSQQPSFGDRTHFWEYVARKTVTRRLLVLSSAFALLCWMVTTAALTETLTTGGICCSAVCLALQAIFALGGHKILAETVLARRSRTFPLANWTLTRRLALLDYVSAYVQIFLLLIATDLMEVSAMNRRAAYLVFGAIIAVLEVSASLPWLVTSAYYCFFIPFVLIWRVARGRQGVGLEHFFAVICIPAAGLLSYLRERHALNAFYEEIETIARSAVADCERRVHEELLTTLIPPYLVTYVLEKREGSRWGCITEVLEDVALLQVRFHCTTLEEQVSATNILGKLAVFASQGSEVDLVSLDGDTAVVGGPLRHPDINSVLDWKNVEKSTGAKWFVSQRRLAGEGQANHSSYVLGAIVADLLFRFRDRPNLLSCVLHRAEALAVVLGVQQPRFSLLGMAATTSASILNAAPKGTICATERFLRMLPESAPQHIPQQVEQEMVSASFSVDGIVSMLPPVPEQADVSRTASSGGFAPSSSRSGSGSPAGGLAPLGLAFPLVCRRAMRWRCRGCPLLYVHPLELPLALSPESYQSTGSMVRSSSLLSVRGGGSSRSALLADGS